MSRPKPIILIERLSKRELRPVCYALNEKDSQAGTRLRDLFKRWLERKFDLRKMLREDRGLEMELRDVCKVNLVPTSDGAQLELRQESSPENYGDMMANYLRRDFSEGRARAERHRANLLFVSLVINPQRSALRGPCANCGLYYVNERIRPAKYLYCSPECYGPGERRRKYREARNKRLDFARACLRQLKGQKEWREKLAEKLTEKFGDTTCKWITHALTQGDLVAPKGA